MSKCRPGDIAIIISSSIPENIGRYVTVIGRPTLEWVSRNNWDPRYLIPGVDAWVVEVNTEPLLGAMAKRSGEPIEIAYVFKQVICRDQRLHPIRPPAKENLTSWMEQFPELKELAREV